MLGFPGFSLIEDETKCAEVKGNDDIPKAQPTLGLHLHIWQLTETTYKSGMHFNSSGSKWFL